MVIIPKKTNDFKMLSTAMRLLSTKHDHRPYICYFFSDADGRMYKTDGHNLCRLLIDYDVPVLSFIDASKNTDGIMLDAVTLDNGIVDKAVSTAAEVLSDLSDRTYLGRYRIDRKYEKQLIIDAISHIILTTGFVVDFMMLHGVMRALSSARQEFTAASDRNGVLISSPRFSFYTLKYVTE